ncbi:MAG: helicase RepA family protein [Gammaproteobacteria bacterium]|nr:helicase RepA family protein [Gammaproteobacteria bacterium]
MLIGILRLFTQFISKLSYGLLGRSKHNQVPQYRNAVSLNADGKHDLQENFETLTKRQSTQDRFSFDHIVDVLRNYSPPEYLVFPFLLKGTINTLFGKGGVGKSFILIDLAMCVATGTRFHGREVRKGGVFYICGEGNKYIPIRVKAWLKHHQMTASYGTELFLSPLPACLIDEMNVKSIEREIKRLVRVHSVKPTLIIIDTLASNIGDADENHNGVINGLFYNLRTQLQKDWNAAVLIACHVGNNQPDRERGATALPSNADGRIKVERDENDNIKMVCMKVKDGPDWETTLFKTESVTIPDISINNGDPATSLVLDEISDNIPQNE